MKYPCLFGFLLVFVSPAIIQANGVDEEDLTEVALDLKEAVLREDTAALMKYVSKSGTSFIDAAYTREQIQELMDDKDGWLIRHLFSSPGSVKAYFMEVTDLSIVISSRGEDAVMFSYQNAGRDPTEWVECCLIRVGGVWYFDGVFSCE